MKKFGLIGYPLSHSFSPAIHKKIYELNKIDASYSLIEISSKNFSNPLHTISEDFEGLNITIPYKTRIMDFLDNISEEAKKVGAVNTIKKIKGKWIGFNTDVEGFLFPISDLYSRINSSLVIGTGGAARAVVFALLEYVQPQQLILIGRSNEKLNQLKSSFNNKKYKTQITKDLSKNLEDYLNVSDLIVNASSVGMHPNVTDSVLPAEFNTIESVIAYDLVYNPQQTKFLEQIAKKSPDNILINGIEMLIAQAVKAVEIWTDTQIPFENTITEIKKSNLFQ